MRALPFYALLLTIWTYSAQAYGWLALASGVIVVIALPFIIALALRPYELRRRARERLAKGECPTCRYKRSGLPADAPCPECGALPTVPQLEQRPPPIGLPVCARCRTSMLGMETRACPECGVMYGIDHVDPPSLGEKRD